MSLASRANSDAPETGGSGASEMGLEGLSRQWLLALSSTFWWCLLAEGASSLSKRHPWNAGFVNFYQARFLDVDANRPQEAKGFYDKALKLLPNNAA